MNLQSLARESFFEFTDRARRNRVRDELKKRRLRNEPVNLPEVPELVGGDSQGAVRDKRAMDRREEILRYQTARRVASFRPGIGKHEMKRFHGIPREQVLDDEGDFESQDAHVRQPGAFDSSAGCAHSTEQTLDPEEISVRVLAGKSREKRTVSAAEIDCDGHLAAEDFLEVERRKTIGRDEFHLAC